VRAKGSSGVVDRPAGSGAQPPSMADRGGVYFPAAATANNSSRQNVPFGLDPLDETFGQEGSPQDSATARVLAATAAKAPGAFAARLSTSTPRKQRLSRR